MGYNHFLKKIKAKISIFASRIFCKHAQRHLKNTQNNWKTYLATEPPDVYGFHVQLELLFPINPLFLLERVMQTKIGGAEKMNYLNGLEKSLTEESTP